MNIYIIPIYTSEQKNYYKNKINIYIYAHTHRVITWFNIFIIINLLR